MCSVLCRGDESDDNSSVFDSQEAINKGNIDTSKALVNQGNIEDLHNDQDLYNQINEATFY